jgi:hypothetical protein
MAFVFDHDGDARGQRLPGIPPICWNISTKWVDVAVGIDARSPVSF